MMNSESLPVKPAVSAGGVVWRLSPAGVEIVLVGRASDGLWALPKGTPEPGESLLETALRETEEETGLSLRAGPKVGVIEYWFTDPEARWHKYVHQWLMEPAGGSFASHDAEYDFVDWVPIGEALERLTYEGERRIAREAGRMLAGSA